MPEFILHFPKTPRTPIKRDFIPKNEYNSKVKVKDWDRERESLPLDYDARNPPYGSQHRSSYTRWGYDKEERWLTETQYMQSQVPPEVGPTRVPMVSFGNYSETKLAEEDVWKMSPEQCHTDYQSTMHADYKVPYPCALKPLTLPKAYVSPSTETNKFLDDCLIPRIKLAQNYNSFRYKSYNPLTFKYSDGSEVEVRVRKCAQLPYSHVN